MRSSHVEAILIKIKSHSAFVPQLNCVRLIVKLQLILFNHLPGVLFKQPV